MIGYVQLRLILFVSVPSLTAPLMQGNPIPGIAAPPAVDEKKFAVDKLIDEKLPHNKLAYLEARKKFVAIAMERKKIEAEHKAIQVQRMEHRNKQRTYKRYAQCQHCCNESCVMCCFVSLGVVFTVLAAIQLQRNEVFTWTTMAPFLSMFGIVACVISCTCYMHYGISRRTYTHTQHTRTYN